MFLDIHELERHPLDFEEEFQPDVIDLGGEARQRTPLKASGHAELVEEHHGKHEVIKDIRLRGLSRGRPSAGRRSARAGFAGAALEGHLPRRLQRFMRSLRQEFE